MLGVELIGLTRRFGSGAAAVAAVADVSLRVARGSFVSLLGPSGCGKTTTLRMIGGLETPDAGEIRIDGVPVYAAASGIDVAPARRKVGFVFQSYALWPHMSVAENLAYPLRRAGLAARAADAKVDGVLAMLKASHLKQRYPGELSGGQQQRVALGRAVINPDNQVVLFDEPLSNLDAKLREDLRMEIRALQEDLGFTAIYVTHDQAEALAMSDHIVIMREGRIERSGTPEEVFHQPRSRYVAEFLGAHNIVPATLAGTAGEAALLDTPLGRLRAPLPPDRTLAPGVALDLTVPIERIRISEGRAGADDFSGRVASVAYYGNHYDLTVEVGPCRLRCRVPASLRFTRGQNVHGGVLGEVALLES